MSKEELILELYKIGAVSFGTFTLKSGITSPLYIDLRLIISYPKLLQTVADHMWQLIKDLPKDCLCGVPYTAMPMATAISLANNIPMIMRRKEVKTYGKKKAIEGAFQKGDRCIIIEDLITSGMSIQETINPLEDEGITVTDCVVLIDREQGGKQNLNQKKYHLHSVLTLTEMLQTLEANKKISPETVSEVTTFIG